MKPRVFGRRLLHSCFAARSRRRALIDAVVIAPMLFYSGAGAAQKAPAAPATESPADDDIVVDGKIPPGAVIGDIPPENQLTPADIASYGVGTVNDLLAQITEMTESDQGRDSSAAPVILVNGKRVSGVNEVGDLPTESIQRIDILPEEVAIKYGYTAEQKVVNIILRRRFYSRVANLLGGMSTDGAGENEGGDFTYTRIHNNDRVNIVGRVASQASVLESDRGVSSTGGTIVDPTGQIANDSHDRTLEPSTTTYTMNAVLAHQFSSKVTASFNARATYGTSDALNGLPSGTLSVPATSPYALSDVPSSIDRYLSYGALHQDTDTATAHGGVTLNVDLPRKWQLSVIGTYDHSDIRTSTERGFDLATLQDDIDNGAIGVDPYGVLPASALGARERQHATAITDTGSSSALIHGTLFKLPAGDVATSLRIGGDFSTLASQTSGFDATQPNRLSRTDVDGQISFDIPLTSRSRHVLGAIGDLSANVNGSVTRVSDFGALGAFGYGLHWTPRKWLSIIASVNQDRLAPTLAQLNDPTVTTSNVRVYDYVQGKTVTVTQIAGGNPDLKADNRHVFKLGFSIDAIDTPKTKLNFVVDYIHSVLRNAIGTISSATDEAEEAFPDRFERDASGTLEQIDARAVNLDREDRSEVRWGFNFTQVLRAPKRPPRPQGFRRWRGGQRPDGAPPAGGGQGGPEGGAPLEAEGGPPPGQGDASPQAGTPGADDQGIVVNGQRNTGGDAFGQPGQTRGWGRGGFGGGQHHQGGPNGHGDHRGPPGGFYAGNGAQLQLSFYHSWYFRDDVRLAANGPTVDLLNGGTIGSGGQPRHKLQANAGLFDNGLGVRLSGNWISPTKVDEEQDDTGSLYYSSLATFDLRLFADLQQRLPHRSWARGARVTLSLTNLLDTRQHVHDAAGATPLIYEPAFLDPYGRTVSVTFRKIL
jgi:iron complex outermembrane receptor protein